MPLEPGPAFDPRGYGFDPDGRAKMLTERAKIAQQAAALNFRQEQLDALQTQRGIDNEHDAANLELRGGEAVRSQQRLADAQAQRIVSNKSDADSMALRESEGRRSSERLGIERQRESRMGAKFDFQMDESFAKSFVDMGKMAGARRTKGLAELKTFLGKDYSTDSIAGVFAAMEQFRNQRASGEVIAADTERKFLHEIIGEAKGKDAKELERILGEMSEANRTEGSAMRGLRQINRFRVEDGGIPELMNILEPPTRATGQKIPKPAALPGDTGAASKEGIRRKLQEAIGQKRGGG